MAKEFKLPDLGENIESADVLNILVKSGDQVEKEQSVIEIETDKATIEVPSSIAGTVKDVLIKPGDKVKVGQSILTFDEGNGKAETKSENNTKKTSEKKKEESDKEKNEASNKSKTESDEKEKTSTKAEEKSHTKEEPKTKKSSGSSVVEMKLPDLGENIDSADVLNILVKPGDILEKDQGILEIETDKATIEVPSSISGTVKEVLVKAGEKAKVGQAILKVETTSDTEPENKKETSAKEEKSEQKKEDSKETSNEEESSEKELAKGQKEKFQPGEIDEQPPIRKNAAPAAPSVRRIAREIGVNIQNVTGTGPNGRISMDDVKGYAKRLNEERESGGYSAAKVKAEALPDFSKFGEVEVKAMNKIRSVTADHLSYAWNVIPHVTQFDKADITELEKIRKQFNPSIEKSGGKLTITAILLKVITSALKVFPKFNSSIDLQKKEIIYKKYFNIGIAVDTPNGLLVPVLKNVDKKNLTELSIEMNELAKKARNKKTSLEELQGACFTITNLGGIGGTSFTPIVNSPEVSILGVSRGSMEPVYNKHSNQFEPKLMLPLSLSYDHRIIDGADAARFLRWVCEALEQPIKVLVEG